MPNTLRAWGLTYSVEICGDLSQDEEKYVILGCVQGILYVVYTMRDEYARLISARMATPYERKIYYGEE